MSNRILKARDRHAHYRLVIFLLLLLFLDSLLLHNQGPSDLLLLRTMYQESR